MNLPIPGVGTEAGPAYGLDVNAAFTLVDQHDHTPGKGVQITPAGLNINSNVNFNSFSAVSLASTMYVPQASLATLTSVYVSGVDLYYNDANGNVIQLTASGSPAGGAGSITGLPSGTAGAAYSAGTFTFSASTNTPANLQAGSVLLGNNTALSKYLTLSPPNSMAANYQLILPTIPAATSFMTMDSSGAMGTSVALNGALTTTNLSATAGILGSQLANATIPGSKIAAGTITSSNIASATILGSNIAAATITGTNIAQLSIGGTQLVNNPGFPGVPAGSSGANDLLLMSGNRSPGRMMIRGTVAFNGAIQQGEGFTVTKFSTGYYQINITSPFTQPPTVVATPQTPASTPFIFAMIDNSVISGSAFRVYITTGAGVATDSQFCFMAVSF